MATVPPSETLSLTHVVDNSKKPRYSVDEVLTIAAFLELYADDVRHLLHEKVTKDSALSNNRSQRFRNNIRSLFTTKGQFFNHIAEVGKDAAKLGGVFSQRGGERLALLYHSRSGPSLQQFWTDVLMTRHRLWSRQFIGLPEAVDPANSAFEEWLRSNRNADEVSEIMGRVDEYRKEFNGRQSWTWREFEPVMRAVDMICRDDIRTGLHEAISSDDPHAAYRLRALLSKTSAGKMRSQGYKSQGSLPLDGGSTDAASSSLAAHVLEENERPAKKPRVKAMTTDLVEALNRSTQFFWAGAADFLKAIAPAPSPATPPAPTVTRDEMDELRAEVVSVREEMLSMRQDMASIMREVLNEFLSTRQRNR
jgi:hypothetical protein